jgi:4-alpha-glucanotransferase
VGVNFSLDQKLAGILVPVFALRGRHDLGIGDTAALIEFIDWAAEEGFSVVKILPINETAGNHSPYKAICSRALEPLTIHTTPQAIPELPQTSFEAALRDADASGLAGDRVDYPQVCRLKMRLLEAAFEGFQAAAADERRRELGDFREQQREWLEDYTLFQILNEHHGQGVTWNQWPPEQQNPLAAREWLAGLAPDEREALEARRHFYEYVQWIAFSQWREVKAVAERQGVALMGDIPFGVDFESMDVWANPQQFKSGWWGGTPPDKFFTHDGFVQKWGQNWGIPLYEWEAMREDGFLWWRRRVRGVREFFDLFRIDHVLGFYRIYAFPWPPQRNAEFLPLTVEEAAARSGGRRPGFHPRADDTQESQEANRREGEEYLKVVLEESGAGRVVGEDLGEVPVYVRPSLTSLGIAGYKIPAWETRPDGELIRGGDYQRLSLVTYATHDHEPLKVMWETHAAKAKQGDANALEAMAKLARYAELEGDLPDEYTPSLHNALVRALLRSNSWLAIFMITDLLGRTERFNIPGVAGDSWTQRLHVPVAELRHDEAMPAVRQALQESGRSARGDTL